MNTTGRRYRIRGQRWMGRQAKMKMPRVDEYIATCETLVRKAGHFGSGKRHTAKFWRSGKVYSHHVILLGVLCSTSFCIFFVSFIYDLVPLQDNCIHLQPNLSYYQLDGQFPSGNVPDDPIVSLRGSWLRCASQREP